MDIINLTIDPKNPHSSTSVKSSTQKNALSEVASMN